MLEQQGLITHVALVLDASSSMQEHQRAMLKVVDNQVKFLAQLSQAANHEVRVTIYQFSDPDRITCLLYEKDVLRLPSIAEFYQPEGWTALIDATILAIEDLKMTPLKYGDHAFLMFVFTDGAENRSKNPAYRLSELLSGLDDAWTVAGLVPDINGKLMMQRYGLAPGNVTIWDPNAKHGVEEAGQVMEQAMDSYMIMRSTGGQSTRTLFSTAADAVNATTIKAAGLKPLDPSKYTIVPVPRPPADAPVSKKLGVKVWEISEFVTKAAGKFTVGEAYYELKKSERIAANKRLAILELKTNRVFMGDGVRAMIGLPEENKTVMPDFNANYAIFVQSTSTNRHLTQGTRVIILK